MISKQKKTLLFILIPVAILAVYFIVTYNSFVSKDEEMKKNWNEVQNAYQRRLDLIPNLVSVVKGSSDYEKQVLKELTEARSKAGSLNVTSDVDKNNYDQTEQAQANVTSSMSKVVAVVENYPDLQSVRSYVNLMEQLKGTERRIKFARKDFNESVASYNRYVRKFPSSIVASLFGFKKKEGFQSDVGADKSTEVKF